MKNVWQEKARLLRVQRDVAQADLERHGVTCDRPVTHVVREPAELDDDGRDVIYPARARLLCPKHARAYDKTTGSMLGATKSEPLP